MANKVWRTDFFNENYFDEFRIPSKSVSKTVLQPDIQEFLQLSGLTIGFFIKWEPDNSSMMLIIAQLVQDTWNVHAGFKTFPDFISDIELKPMKVLEKIVERFGIELTIGKKTARLFFNQQIPLKSKINDIAELVSIDNQNSNAGHLLIFGRIISNQSQDLTLHCALAFAIDSYTYTKYLFKWDTIVPNFNNWLPNRKINSQMPSSIGFSNEEINNIWKSTKALFPNSSDNYLELVNLRGAFLILQKTFGDKWYSANMQPATQKNFMVRDWENTDEQNLGRALIVWLAQALYLLKATLGFPEKILHLRDHSINNGALESLWFEFYVPLAIKENGHRIINFVSEELPGKKPDIIIDFRTQLLPIEIKAKLEDAQYSSPRDLRQPIADGCKQLPETGPGVIFLLIPPHWTVNDQFIDKADKIIKKALTDNRNCNAVFIFWFTRFVAKNGARGISWRFKSFTNTHPRYPISKITEIIKVNTLTEDQLAFPMSVSYLNKSAQ